MRQYLLTYRHAPTLANAKRLMAYVDKHPMATCLATLEDLKTLEAAKEQLELATFA